MDQNPAYISSLQPFVMEQTPGGSIANNLEKLKLRKGPARLGIDVIEAGFPAASPRDEAVQTIAREVKGVTICALARANEKGRSKGS